MYEFHYVWPTECVVHSYNFNDGNLNISLSNLGVIEPHSLCLKDTSLTFISDCTCIFTNISESVIRIYPYNSKGVYKPIPVIHIYDSELEGHNHFFMSGVLNKNGLYGVFDWEIQADEFKLYITKDSKLITEEEYCDKESLSRGS